MVENLKNKNYSQALNIVNDKNFYDNDSILLKKLEQATTYYLSGQYFQSLKFFDEASDINEKLYTKSISNALSGFADDNLSIYYGENYELSLIRFYKSLINYKLYIVGKYESYKNENNKTIPEKILTDKERRQHLIMARSIMIEWDSFLKKLQKENAGKNTFKNDLLAKIWGGFIHEEFGSNEDKQIALQLYKDAKIILFRNYNNYEIFNKKNKEFEKNFKKLPYSSLENIKNNYIDETDLYTNLMKYLDKKIENLKNNKKDNLIIVLNNNFIERKKAKEIVLPFTTIISTSDEMKNFSLNVLNLNQIKFELPYIDYNNFYSEFVIKIFDINNKLIKEKNILLVEPISNIAYTTLNNKLPSITLKTSSLLATKYLAAISTAYAMYQTNENYGDLFFNITFYAGIRLINKYSLADLRQWSTLPNDIRFYSTNINNDFYKIRIYKKDNFNNETLIFQKDIDNIEKKSTFFDLNIF